MGKKSKKLLIVLAIIITMLIIVIIVFLVFNSKGKNKNDDNILSTAEIYNYSEISKTLKENAAKATEYNDEFYVMYGTVTNIDIDNLTLSNETSGTIKVYLETELLKNIDKNKQISVVGKINNASINPGIMKEAKILSQEELEKYFIIDITKEKGTKYPNYTYSNYKYDENGNPIEYDVKGDSNGRYTLKYDESGNLIEKSLSGVLYGNEVYKYVYDENNNLVSESQIDYNENGDETRNNIFDYTIEKNSNGQIIKKNGANRNSPDFSYEFTYEYDGEKISTETEYSHYSDSTYVSKYTYDSYGYKLSKNTTGEFYNNVKYTYAIVAKK